MKSSYIYFSFSLSLSLSRQIFSSSTPIHPVLPALIEVYVNSVLVPASNRSVPDQTNEPISEAQIRAVFKKPVFEVPSALTDVYGTGGDRRRSMR